jgi:hypothetical protein
VGTVKYTTKNVTITATSAPSLPPLAKKTQKSAGNDSLFGWAAGGLVWSCLAEVVLMLLRIVLMQCFKLYGFIWD